jgi:hypothetical protein
MTNTTTQHHLNDTFQLAPNGLAPLPAPAHPRRRLHRAAIAAATAAVVVAGLGSGSAHAASSSVASVRPVPASKAAPTQYQLVCDLGTGGVSEIAAALDDCLAPLRTQPFSPIAAVPMPAQTS